MNKERDKKHIVLDKLDLLVKRHEEINEKLKKIENVVLREKKKEP